MKRNYIQPQTEAQCLQSVHVICTSRPGEIITNPIPGDPNAIPIV